jgi:hypothetical protein
MKYLFKLFRIFLQPLIFIFGYIYFLILKKKSHFAYQAYVATYCITSGFVSQLLSYLISLINKSFLKNKKINSELTNISNELKIKGYSIFEKKIEEDLLMGLVNLTKKLKCNYSKYDINSPKVIFNEKIHFSPSYYYDQRELLNQKEVQDVIKFLMNLNISDTYFDSKSYLLAVNMWWSTVSEKTDTHSAQEFHFDCDSIKWLKYFIYLTDVTLESGPHVYVEGSHKSFSKPYSLLKKGYVRIKDDEIEDHYGKEKIHKIIGNKGTLVVGDTSCFHKGMVPKKNSRLIFEITLSNSHFADPSVLDFNQMFFNLNNKLQNKKNDFEL